MNRLARPDSLLGKLQRGLGSGYLEALQRPRATASRLVLRCIADHPRLDAQSENRDLYYARLVLALDIDTARFETILRGRPQAGPSGRDHLALEVLGVLARAGRTAALAIVQDYVGWGEAWASALWVLDEADPSAWKGLDTVLRARFPADATARTELRYGIPSAAYRAWQADGPLAAVLDPMEAPPARPSPGLGDLPAEALLHEVRGVGLRRDPAAALLAERVRGGRGADRAVVEAALHDPRPAIAAPAINVLGLLGDPAIIEPAQRTIGRIHGPSHLLPMILRGLVALPPEVALPLARRWRDAPGYRSYVATQLLRLYATAEDLPWVVERIRRSMSNGYRSLGEYAGILERFPGQGPFAGVEATYRRYVPSCCRADLVRALSLTDPTFGSTLAYECLYDSEEVARLAAAAKVGLTSEAVARLGALVADPLEADAVRQSALARLT